MPAMPFLFRRPRLTLRLLLAAIALLPLRALAQYVDFEHLSVEDGLSQNTVTCLLQDRQGFVWVGTEYGLNRYDGYRFVVYKSVLGDSTSLTDNRITALHEDLRGNIWVGTESGGLLRFSKSENRFYRYQHSPHDPASLSDDRVTAIAGAATGVVWVGTANGLNRLDLESGQFQHFLHDPIDPQTPGANHIYALAKQSADTLLIGHAQGFDVLAEDGLRFERHRSEHAVKALIPSNSVHTGLLPPNTRWLTGTEAGLMAHHPDMGTTPMPVEGLQDVSSLLAGPDRSLWVGTSKGLFRLSKHHGWEHFIHYAADRNSLSSSYVHSLMADASGIVWIGTYAGGVNKYLPSRQAFGHFKHIAGDEATISHNDVTALCADASGRLWVGTTQGLDLLDSTLRRVAHFGPGNSGLSGPHITCLLPDAASGGVWVGTRRGLNLLKPGVGTVAVFQHWEGDPHSLSHNNIYSLHLDREGVLWVGTAQGLNRLDPRTGTVQRFMAEPDNPIGLGGNMVTAICGSPDGMLWVGTYDAGLYKFNPGTEIFKSYRQEAPGMAGMGANSILSLYRSPSGSLWVGTFEGGLNLLPAGAETFSAYTEEQGLPNNQVYGILPDAQGYLWCSTNDKLVRFDPNSELFRSYDIKDGLQGNEFNANAYAQGPDGRLFFGGPNGFNAFYPEAISDNAYAPNVVLTAFELFNQPVGISASGPLRADISTLKEVVLAHHQNTFSFEFAALGYQLPERNQYAYLMEGIDMDWQQIGRRRKAYFTGLAPGEYVLRVMATNSDGVWNKQAISLRVVVLAPFWRTWWFAVLLVGGLSALSYYIYLGYQRRVAERVGGLERQVEEMRRMADRKSEQLQQQVQEHHRLQLELGKSMDLLMSQDQQRRKQEREMEEGMSYALRIQESLLTPQEELLQHLPESFLFFEPKLVVGGNFYWMSEAGAKGKSNNRTVIAIGDCAGKGIAGALLSMVGMQMLHEVVNMQGIKGAKKILDVLNHNFAKTLNHQQGNTFYGMDLAVCTIDWQQKVLEFAGAQRPLFYLQHGEMHTVKGDPFPIGISDEHEAAQGFTSHTIGFYHPTTFYLSTDGFEDQLGGSENRKYMQRRLKELLSTLHDLPMETQRLHLEREFVEWRGEQPQIDDVCVLGFRLPRKMAKVYQA
jgi:ligand-binding sensor domain-containing protein/serine phosphatase RsbU (regulator of sigma subunit)